ncbi:MAG: hypothetical protein IJ071_06665 [Ruminococcus sp.]|nr:hypothetical protein [Ruminococcus sp.]
MGNKISWEDAEKLGGTTPNDSIFAPPNKYGYRINIAHPQIRPLFEKYCEKVGEKILSDAQRHHFEGLIYTMLARREKLEQGHNNGPSDC